MKSHWKTIPKLQQNKKSERKLKETLIKRRWCKWWTTGSARRLERCERDMQKTVPWTHSNYWILKHNNSSTPKPQPAVRRPRRVFVQTWFFWMEYYVPATMHARLHLRRHSDNRATPGGQRGTGTLHPGVNSFFFFDRSRWDISLAVNFNLLAIDGWSNKNTYRAHVFLMCTLSVLVWACCHSCSSSSRDALTSRTRVSQAQHEALRVVSCPKSLHLIVQSHTLHLTCVNRTPSHRACTDAHSASAHHIALIPCTTSVAQGYTMCAQNGVCSFHLSCAMSLVPLSTMLAKMITY